MGGGAATRARDVSRERARRRRRMGSARRTAHGRRRIQRPRRHLRGAMSTSRLLVVTRPAVAGYNDATMTDALLVRAALDGDSAAFATLVQRHGRVCLRYATRMLGNQEDAEDVTQEAFVRAYGALGRYDARVQFRTWLMTILINRCRTALSRRRTQEERIVRDADVAAIPMVTEQDDMALRDM